MKYDKIYLIYAKIVEIQAKPDEVPPWDFLYYNFLRRFYTAKSAENHSTNQVLFVRINNNGDHADQS
jgi:hypothetical protein